jgi:hypothetical protein
MARVLLDVARQCLIVSDNHWPKQPELEARILNLKARTQMLYS